MRFAGLVEFGGLDGPPSKGPASLLLRGAASMFPGLTFESKRTWMGHRPAPVDSLPVIGPAPANKNVVFAYGHHHVGLTAGPRTGRILAGLISGEKPNIDLAPYAPDRFL